MNILTDMNFKHKTIFFVLSIISAMLLIITLQFLFNEKQDYDLYIEHNHKLIHHAYDLAQKRTKEKFVAHLSALHAVPDILKLIKTRDRKKLYAQMTPSYRELQKNANHAVNVYHIYLPDGTSFLRLHKPEQFGDNNYDSRPLLRKAIESKKVATGYEIGKFGLFYRIEYPLMDKGELIAVIDMGIHNKEMDQYLKPLAKMKTVTKTCDRACMFSSVSNNTVRLNPLSSVQGDQETLEMLQDLNLKTIENKQLLNYRDKYYHVDFKNILGAEEELLAKRIHFIDITQAYHHTRNTIAIHVLTILITLILTGIILNYSLKAIIGKLFESENRLNTLFDSMKMPIVVFHLTEGRDDFVYKDMNQKAQEISHSKKENLIGKRLSENTYPDIHLCLFDLLAKVSKASSSQHKSCVAHEDGKIKIWYELFVYKLPNEDLVAMIDDVTEQKQNEQSKQKLQASLRQSNILYKRLTEDLDERIKTQTGHMLQQSRMAQMGEMISMIAHQWRQPLASISAISGTLSIDAMMDEYKKEFFIERLHQVSELSLHLSSTIDDFRGFFSEDKASTETSLKEMAEASLRIISPMVQTKGITIKKSYENEDTIKTYYNEVNQVILNVLKNAEDILLEKQIKDPVIHISTYAKEKKVYLSIQDNAGGVPEDIIDNIFDPYFSTKLKKDGTGLGLYMSRTIIKEHCGGNITVRNVGEGACFTLELPLMPEEKR